MSLKTDFVAKEQTIALSNVRTENLLDGNYVYNLFEKQNQWVLYKYNGNKGSSTYQPTLSDVTGKTPNNTYYYTDGSDRKAYNLGDYYTASKECWVITKNAFNWFTTFSHDDYGAVYLNDSLVTRGNSVRCN